MFFMVNHSDTIFDQTHSEALENCHFHVFAIFKNRSQLPTWIARSHKFKRTLSADYSD